MALVEARPSPVKPQRWNVNAALIAPKWRSLWHGLKVAYPFWEGGGTVLHSVISHRHDSTGVAGDPTWEATRYGVAMRFDSNDSVSIPNFAVPPAGTVFFMALVDNLTSNRRPWGSSDRFESFWSTAGTLTNDCWQAGTDNTRSNTSTVTTNLWYKFGMTWDSTSGVDGTQRIYTDGVELGSYLARGPADDDPGTNTLSIGKRTGSDNFSGLLNCWYMWDRRLRDTEQLQLARDPWGFLRMSRPMSASVIAAAAAARRIFITSG